MSIAHIAHSELVIVPLATALSEIAESSSRLRIAPPFTRTFWHSLCFSVFIVSRNRNDSSPARLTMAQAAEGAASAKSFPHPAAPHHGLGSALRPVRSFSSRVGFHLTLIIQSQSEPEILTTSHSVPTHLQGRTDTETSVGLSAALGCDIDLSALSRAASVNSFTPFEQQLILQARLLAELDTRPRPFYNSQAAAH